MITNFDQSLIIIILPSRSQSDQKEDAAKSLENEFERLIEEKIRKEHKLESGAKLSSAEKEEDFYDENLDDEDEQFVQSLNRSRTAGQSEQAASKTDATLNCPCCMSLLSLETQRHVSYRNQYRAMFTFNTKVDMESPVEPINKPSKKRKKNKKQSNIIESDPELTYYPVSCSVCSTEVGVYDSDEVYHFYNTIASY